MTHDETKWAIKFSGGEVLQAQSAQRFAIFMKQLFIFLQENPTILCYKNHYFKQQDTTFLLLYKRYYEVAVLRF